MQSLNTSTILQGGKYRIERVLGQGGFGITYLAEQVSLGRKVAIKEFFMKDLCMRDDVTKTVGTPSIGSSRQVEMYRKKFVKEANNLARLNHPNIISVNEVFEENGTVYYSMPYLSGGSLYDYVRVHGALSESQAMRYVRQIAAALKYMHEDMHICHFDVKPANIILDSNNNAVLIDFGISKNYDAQGNQTSTTPIGLSEGYAPIEQYQQNVADFSPVSDVYALGATLYFLLHGKRPVNAPSRAGGTVLLMKKSLSSSIKDIINASMKISKAERAKNMDVFLKDNYAQALVEEEQTFFATNTPRSNYQNSEKTRTAPQRHQTSSSYSSQNNTSRNNGNSYIGWILGIVIICAAAFFILSNQKNTNEANSVNSVPTNEINVSEPKPESQPQNTSQETQRVVKEEKVFDFTGSWECPDVYNSDMNLSLILKHGNSRNSLEVDYLVNVRLYTFDMAVAWVEGNTLHIKQNRDIDGNYLEIVAKPVSDNRIEGALKYKNPYTSYNGKLIMNR